MRNIFYYMILAFCFLVPTLSPAQDKPALSGATDKQLNEAQAVYEYCKSNQSMSLEYDCKCFSSGFLKERIKQGPVLLRDGIFVFLKGTCKNIVANKEFEYRQCIQGPLLFDLGNRDKKDYCDCYVRHWAKLYQAHVGPMFEATKVDIRSQSLSACQKPSAYK